MNSKSLNLLEMSNDLVNDLPSTSLAASASMPTTPTSDPGHLRNLVHEKLVKDMQIITSAELNEIMQNAIEHQAKDFTPDEAIINEMVQGLCTTKQKTTFVKIIAKYIRYVARDNLV